MEKQLLIGLDHSPQSAQALTYVSKLFASQADVSLQLLHCYTGGQSVLPTPEDHRNSLTPDQPVSKILQKGQRLLAKAKHKLEQDGVASERISTVCQSGSQIAATINQIGTQELVDAVVVARRGVGVVGELLLGSVSSALFDACRTTPLWVIDGDVRGHNFLVPVDGTPNSLMAIDHLAHIFAGRSDLKFYLFHVRGFLSSTPVCKPQKFYDKWGQDWCDTHLSGDGCMFTGPTELLTDTGIPQSSVITLPEPTAIEESSAIISAAKKHDCGTIVIGRRPESEVSSFFGGVSKRTIRQAENLALWVVG